MENGIKERVILWAQSGGDFQSGLSLFLTFNRNVYYVRNIEAKGAEKGLVTLISEFSHKSKIPAPEIWAFIKTGIPQKIVTVAPPRDEVQEKRLEKNTLKLREEFPFLGRKDCPPELAILVNRMLTAYDDYRNGREKLYDLNMYDKEACYTAAREVLDAYILNRDCWEELNHYKQKGELLGNLPEFKARKLKEDYTKLSTIELYKKIKKNIPRRMAYYHQQLNDKKTKNREEIIEMMAGREAEIVLIKQILRDRGELE